jgi:hypothetical protein
MFTATRLCEIILLFLAIEFEIFGAEAKNFDFSNLAADRYVS